MKLNIKDELKFFYGAFISYFSFFGSFPFWTLTVVFLLILGKKDFAWLFASSAIFVMIVEHIIKFIWKVKRPDYKLVKPISVYQKFQEKTSFPSGHVANIVLFTTLIALKFSYLPFTLFFSLMTVLSAMSRIYLKKHTIKDVVGGLVIGVLIGLLSFNL